MQIGSSIEQRPRRRDETTWQESPVAQVRYFEYFMAYQIKMFIIKLIGNLFLLPRLRAIVQQFKRNHHAPLSVLIVDDDPSDLSLMSMKMKRMGFEVLEACDGMDAVRLLQQQDPRIDLAILDFNMPMMNGVDTFAALRLLRPGLTAILCTGNTSSECLGGRTIEGLYYLSKTFDPAGLEATLHLALA